jgi:hypothetical protein
VTFTGPTGTFRQRTDPTKPQTDLYARLNLPLPKKIIEITLCRSKSHRGTSGGVAVLVDEATEDPSA